MAAYSNAAAFAVASTWLGTVTTDASLVTAATTTMPAAIADGTAAGSDSMGQTKAHAHYWY